MKGMKTSKCICIFIFLEIRNLASYVYDYTVDTSSFYLLLFNFTGIKMASVKVKSTINKAINTASFNHLFSIIYTTRING